MSWIKLINLQTKIICNRLNGCNAYILTNFLMSLHIGKRPIWLTRTGHSGFDGTDTRIIWTDKEIRMPNSNSKLCNLNKRGRYYAKRLSNWMKNAANEGNFEGNVIHCSTVPRATETADIIASQLGIKYRPWTSLNMLDCGPQLVGLTVPEIQHKFPN